MKKLEFFGFSRFVRKTVSFSLQQVRKFFGMSRQFLPHMQKYSDKVVISLLSSIGTILFGMLEPWPLKLIFDNIFLDEPLPAYLHSLFFYFDNNKLMILNILVGFMIIIVFFKAFLHYTSKQMAIRASQKIASEIRLELYGHLQRLSFSFHDRRKTGDLLSRLSSDMNVLKGTLISLPLAILTDLLLIIAMVSVMAFMDLQLTLIALLVIPLLMILMKKYRLPLKKAMKAQREKESHLSNLAFEGLGAVKVVQGFHREAYEISKFGVQNKNSLSSGLKATRLEAKLSAASEFSLAIVTALVLGTAGRRVLGGAISPGELIVFAYYLRTFNRPFKRISRLVEQMSRAAASGERIIDLLHIEPTIKEKEGAKTAPKFKGKITYSNVFFEYKPGKPILKGIDLSISPGEKIAFVGKSGIGKSTLASLLPRFYDCVEGEILIDDICIREWTLKSLRKQISVIFQEPVLFATTIAENIAYGNQEASFEEIMEISKKIKIHDMIMTLPKGYNTTVAERGGNLSGGQKQCIAIARSMIKKAPIVILDEPTSALDPISSMMVIGAIKELICEKTAIIISHQQELIDSADRIYEFK